MRVEIEEPADTTLRRIGDGLAAYNAEHAGAPPTPAEFVVTLRTDSGELVGGLRCDLYLGGLHVEWAWIASEHRGQGHGRALLATAEAHGRVRGARMAHLDTFNFQAIGFYERCGYEVFGRLDYSENLKRFYMRRDLTSPPVEGGS